MPRRSLLVFVLTFVSLQLFLTYTKALICNDDSFLQRSVDFGGIYFRILPVGACRSANKTDIEFWVQSPGAHPKSRPHFITADDSDERLLKYFDPNLPTAVYIHGFFEGPKSSSLRSLRTAYLLRKGYNFMAVNWQPLASAPWYPMAVIYYPMVANEVAKLIDRLASVGAIKMETLHLMGFSLGAQVCGAVAKQLKSGRVPRITAFDPALPLIRFMSRDLKLDNTSADFVDVIHTCGGFYGIYRPIGHVDFYPNGGTYIQPGCWASYAPATCSHWRSWRFYVESVMGGEFEATSCESWDKYQKGLCDNNEKTLMGLTADTNARGSFYLRTSWDTPYAL